MASSDVINDNPHEQWQKLKGKGFVAHLQYFWDYYKYFVLGGILVIIFLTALIHDITSTLPEGLYVVYLNSTYQGTQDELIADYTPHTDLDTENYSIVIDTSFSVSTESYDEYTMSNMQKLMALTASHDLDVLVGDTDMYSYYSRNEMLADLRDYYSEEELAAFGDKVFYVDKSYIQKLEEMENATDEELEAFINSDIVFSGTDASVLEDPIPVGIVCTDSSVITDNMLYYNTDCVIGMVVNTERPEEAMNYINYILGND